MISYIKKSINVLLVGGILSSSLSAMEAQDKNSNSLFSGWFSSLSSLSSLSSSSISSTQSSQSLESTGDKIKGFFNQISIISFEHGPIHGAVAAALIPWNGRTDIPLSQWSNGELLSLYCLDGCQLRAHWREVEKGGKTMLLFHGNGMISDQYEHIAEWFATKGYNSLAFTIRGYPGSEGSSAELSVASALDTEAAIRFLVQDKQIPFGKICAYGYSLGGFHATYAAKHFPLGGLILKSSPTTISDLVRNVSWSGLADSIVQNIEESYTKNHNGMPSLMSLGLFEDMGEIPLNTLNNLENVKNLKTKNLMIIYGELDTLTGGEAGAKKLKNSFTSCYFSPFRFVTLPKGAHSTCWLSQDGASICVEIFLKDISK